ncbi:MAG TPA: class I SAM-dependent rRNA methyltransferase [candidate division Zixibacteria bacterium]|nr:class I SAM-dependent rRNA methyltransferase [candidate division Zixibacteria bacterium]
MLKVFLKKGRELPVLRGHSWIFSGAVEKAHGDTEAPSTTEVFDHSGKWIARGLSSPKSQIRVRVLTWRDEPIDRDFFRRRILDALELRRRQPARSASAWRLVNGEGDFLPGLIVDRYGDFLVCQFLTAGIEALKAWIVEALSELLSPKGIFERSEGRVREEEELPPSLGVLAGEAPPERLAIEEHGFRFEVDVWRGQKTGFFLDQRDNRAFLGSLAPGERVLDCFCYSGAFSAYAYRAGAREVISVDSSGPALELARRNLELNGLPAGDETLIKADAFSYLKADDASFDTIVLDPPSLAHRRADAAAAAGGYKFLNLHAFRRVKPGGLLLTFSCSQHVSADLFQKIVFGAAVDARRRVAVLKRLGQSVDHPVSLHHPEGEYLKGLALRVLN